MYFCFWTTNCQFAAYFAVLKNIAVFYLLKTILKFQQAKITIESLVFPLFMVFEQ